MARLSLKGTFCPPTVTSFIALASIKIPFGFALAITFCSLNQAMCKALSIAITWSPNAKVLFSYNLGATT